MAQRRPPTGLPPHGGISRRRSIKRRSAKPRSLRPRRWLRLAVVAASLVGLATVLAVAGLTFNAPLTATPISTTSTPSPVPLTTIAAQTANVSPSSTRPEGVASLSAQTEDTEATTTPVSGGPSITSQSDNAVVVYAPLAGTVSIGAQTAAGSLIEGAPEGIVPSQFASYYAGTFSVDIDSDGDLDTVHFVLIDFGIDEDDDIDEIRLSSDDDTFDENALGSLFNQITGEDDDEGFSQGTGSSTSQIVTLGTYKFAVEFQHAVTEGTATASITSVTWYRGEFEVDLDASGTVGPDDKAYYVLSDTNSDGLYDTIDLETDDGFAPPVRTFGEGSLDGQTPRQTGSNDDERLTSSDTQTAVRLGAFYTFTVAFDNNPGTTADTSDATLTAKTRFTGSFQFDVNANGTVADDGSETINISVFDTDSDGLYDTLDAILGSGSFTNTISGALTASDGERVSSGDSIRVGDTYYVTVEFDADQAAPEDSDDARITLVSSGPSSPIAFTGSWTIDADGDKVADDSIFFVLSDTDSNGVVDTIDISSGGSLSGAIFGEGDEGIEDGVVDFDIVNGTNDERVEAVAFLDFPNGVPIRLGTHTFLVIFDTDIFGDTNDARITSTTWYKGTLSVDLTDDRSNETLDFVQVDANSDGLYETIELDANDNGSYNTGEVHTASGQTITLGNGQAKLTFSLNPTETSSVVLNEASTPTSVVNTLGSSVLPTAADLLGLGGDQPAGEQTQNNFPEPPDQGQVQASQEEQVRQEAVQQGQVPQTPKAPQPSQITRDSTGQLVLQDQMVIAISFDVARPDQLITDLALRFGGQVVGGIPEARTYQVEFNVPFLGALEAQQLALQDFPGVDFVSRHYLMDGILSKVPETPSFGDEWNERRPSGNNWNFELIRAPSAWDITTGSKAVKVAVVDGEFDDHHIDLRSNVVTRLGPRTAGLGGHGTHVAGTICADGRNSAGVVGMSWECSLYLQDFGGSSSVTAQREMVRAVNEDVDIVNVSAQWVDNNQCGLEGTAETLKKVTETNALMSRSIRYAQIQQKDILWVFAAGNECRDTRFASPASLVRQFPDNVIVVASIDIDGRLSGFSNFGDLVTVAAPGGNIYSTLPRQCAGGRCVDQFGPQSGTSMAAPHVSGLAALMLAARPGLTPKQIKDCMVSTAFVTPQNVRVINAESAVHCAQSAAAPSAVSAAPAFGGG